MNRALSSQVAAAAGTRQVEATLQADAVVASIDRAVLFWWRGVLRAIREGRQPALRGLPAMLHNRIAWALIRMARWGWQSSTRVLRGQLTRDWAAAALSRHPRRVFEDDSGLSFGLDVSNLWDLLFPPPDLASISRVVFGGDWQERFAALSSLARPEQMATTVFSGMAQGRTQQQIARDLRPLVQGVASSARRIARTEGLRVAHAAQMGAYDQLGDLVAGYQIHATLDERTRPHHAARSGLIWLKTDPRPMQEVLRMEMPTLPSAPNCRCYLSPILTDPGDAPLGPAFENAEAELVPDPLVYREWFAGADDRRRRIAVGSRRYDAMERTLGQRPEWEHFLDPESGKVLTLRDLEAETGQQRQRRLERVRQALDGRRRMAARGSALQLPT